jgi:hypothetical protein
MDTTSHAFSAENLIISKPHKSSGSMVCHMYYPTKKQKFTYTMENALIAYIKPLQQRDENFVYIKAKHANNFMCDFDDAVIEIVKKNSMDWFNTSMNADLIEDYYTTTLVYDKKHKDIIRLKCSGDDDKIKAFVNKNVNITISFDQLRFYKQKFVVECTVADIEEEVSFNFTDTEEDPLVDDDDYDDPPRPNPDDIRAMKEEFSVTLSKYISELKAQRTTIEINLAAANDVLSELEEASDVDSIIAICDKIETLNP